MPCNIVDSVIAFSFLVDFVTVLIIVVVVVWNIVVVYHPLVPHAGED